jgi:diguanylate cyclase (GGDEF)-like protein
LPSVTNRILIFAVLVTLLPSFGLGWAYFNQAEKALFKSSQREMLDTVDQVRREFDFWFKERYYNIRVFASSYLLSEGLEDYLTLSSSGNARAPHAGGAELVRMESYLALVQSEFDDYSRLLIFDRDADLLTQSPQREGSIALPDDWQEQLQAREVIVGEVYGRQGEAPLILAAVPVLSGSGGTLGFLAAEIKLDSLADIMTAVLANEDKQAGAAALSLVGPNGKILLSTRNDGTATILGSEYEAGLPPNELGEYVNDQGVPVLGTRTPMAEFDWHIVMEQGRDQVLAEVIELRTTTVIVVGALATLIGLFAYLLARGIISPLKRLTEAAGKVANGDLDVRIPVQRQDELGTATMVFNDMVDQLRQSRGRLEELSTMDSLTQLANRRHILEILTGHLDRFRRKGTPFSVLLADADHFKRINDDVGHMAGDQVLSELGAIFKRLLRTVDSAGRYGGEEFLIILEDTRGKEALQTAERIRAAVESTSVAVKESSLRFTVSIGVAEIQSGDAEDQLIMRADTALYQAKREGRNRAVLARLPRGKVTHHPAVRELDVS